MARGRSSRVMRDMVAMAFLFGSSQLRRRGEVDDWSGNLLVGRCSGVDVVCRRSG